MTWTVFVQAWVRSWEGKKGNKTTDFEMKKEEDVNTSGYKRGSGDYLERTSQAEAAKTPVIPLSNA